MREIIEAILFPEHHKQCALDTTSLDILLETRMANYIMKYFKENTLFVSDELSQNLNELLNVNFIRNSIIVTEAYKINLFLNKIGIKHLWLKGVADIHRNVSLLKYRKLSDVDILTAQHDLVRNELFIKGFNHGVVGTDGEWKEADSNQIILHEKDHYELFPLTKIITVNDLETSLSDKLMNRYRFFKVDDTKYSTDVVIDIHHKSLALHKTEIQY